MFCEQCGTQLTEDSLFCLHCGAKVAANDAGVEDDDKTVLLHEEISSQEAAQPVTSDAAKTGEPSVPAEAAKAEESSEPAEATVTEEPSESAEAAKAEGPSEAAETAKTEEEKAVESSEAAHTEAETVQTVEISPTGIVETGTAVVVPEAEKQEKFCPNCGAANGMNDLFCQQCGMFFGNTAEKMGGADKTARTRKHSVKKIAVAVAALLAVLVLGIVVVPRILGGLTAKDQELDFFMYLKDNELTMARKNKYEPVVIGDRMFDEEPDDYTGLSNNNGGIVQYSDGTLQGSGVIQYSPDRQYVYYPQKGDEDFDLYRKKLGSKKAEAEKIDSHVTKYKVIDNDRLIYSKDSVDRKLYLYRRGEAEKIASDAWDMRLSADGKYIMWQDDDGRWYVQGTDLKSDKVKLDSDVNQIYAVSDDFSTIVYQKEDKLYVMKGMEEKEKIASDVYRAYAYDINGSLKMYYLKSGEQTDVSYYDLVDDDCLVQDQQMAEPRIEDYQKVTYKDSFWGMQESVEVDDSYYEELEKYRQKQERDNLRYSLENNSLAMEECDIYYYEDAAGESNKVMTLLKPQGVTVYASIAKNSALMYAYNMDLEQIGKTRLSDLAEVEYYEIQQEIEKQLGDGGQLLYIESGVVHEIEDYEGGSEYLGSYLGAWADEKNQILYISDHSGESTNLYSYAYGRKDASLELVTDELMRVVSREMDELCYINEEEELYYGDTKIAEDVGAYEVWENKAILYLTDMDKDGKEGTLHLYQNGKDTKIADDVAPAFGYGMFDADKVAFLTDYNFKKNRGDLNVYDGREVKNIDSDVNAIIF